jgi:methylmalonyl-CoA mutase cobalamin-binding domain/chain
MALKEQISQAMADLEEEDLYAAVQQAAAEQVPTGDILGALQEGMTKVGELFAKGDYFLSELMMSAELFGECQKLIGTTEEAEAKYGTAVIGTVAGDIHDIGKNIVVSLFRSNGFKVIDVGVDAPPEAFIAAIKEHNPKIVGLSCLLTTAFESMKDLISRIRSEGLDKGRLLLIGGGPVEAGTVEYVGADTMCRYAQDGVLKAIEFVTA